ncbi:GTPase IMAP family member 5 [Carassius auratus]|uniref:GTPase IMAP family member 5 n=1 Tax=Carassius auratus TaxID=7957 RepID=A0A6P6JB03_CARAU|nr:GTPase IMAP family member 5-like [Carassius auratus]
MKLTNTKPVSLFTLILLFHTVQAEASHDDIDEVRILVVGVRGQSRFSAADLLSGRKDGGQEDREIVKTPVITDGARRMMLVTGPNLCEEDAARQSFTTALFLSSPGPHAVLMLLNLEDHQSQQCDIEKRAQELLGAEVLQYCIVLLLQNHQEPLTGASRGIAGEMINACGGRIHIIRDSEPKPAQRAALIAEIDKLGQLNGGSFYSVHKLETVETIQDMHENQVLSVIYETFGGAVGIIGWIFFISVTALAIYTKGKEINLIYGAAFTVFVLFMVYLRRFLSPDLAIPLNLALLSSLATAANTSMR